MSTNAADAADNRGEGEGGGAGKTSPEAQSGAAAANPAATVSGAAEATPQGASGAGATTDAPAAAAGGDADRADAGAATGIMGAVERAVEDAAAMGFAELGAAFAQYFNQQILKATNTLKVVHDRRQWNVAAVTEKGLKITEPNGTGVVHIPATVEHLGHLLSQVAHL
jgi:hypothetical protein